MSKKTRNIIIAVAVLLVVVVALVLIMNQNKPQAQAGDKTIQVTVVHGDETRKDYSINTNAETLREALDEQNLIEGTESEYGLYVTKVDGEEADEAQEQWWCFSKDGEDLMTGVDTTMISDGDSYEIILNTGW